MLNDAKINHVNVLIQDYKQRVMDFWGNNNNIIPKSWILEKFEQLEEAVNYDGGD